MPSASIREIIFAYAMYHVKFNLILCFSIILVSQRKSANVMIMLKCDTDNLVGIVNILRSHIYTSPPFRKKMICQEIIKSIFNFIINLYSITKCT